MNQERLLLLIMAAIIIVLGFIITWQWQAISHSKGDMNIYKQGAQGFYKMWYERHEEWEKLDKELKELKRVDAALNQEPAHTISHVQLTLPSYLVAMDFLAYAQEHPEQQDPIMLWSAFFEECKQRTISGRENRG